MQVGQVFYLWEFATAVAGSVIGINPFDQPDVEASKVETRKLTDGLQQERLAARRSSRLRPRTGSSCSPIERNAQALGVATWRARSRRSSTGSDPAITLRCSPTSTATRRPSRR